MNLLNRMVIESNKETGCLFYQLFVNDHDRWSYALVERWAGQEELDAHTQTPHWKHFDATVNQFLNSEYEEHHYEEISQ